MYALTALALSGLAVAMPQVTPTSSASGPATTTVGPAIERTQNFTISVQNSGPNAPNSFTLSQGHIGAGQNALILERPSIGRGYQSYLSGAPEDISGQHAYLFQYLPGAPESDSVYGIKVPASGKYGDLQLVTGEPGQQNKQFGVSSSTKALTYYDFEPYTAFFACKDSIGGIKDTYFLKYGASQNESDIPAGCVVVQLYVDYD